MYRSRPGSEVTKDERISMNSPEIEKTLYTSLLVVECLFYFWHVRAM